MTVGPEGLHSRRWYLWHTIVLARARLGLEGLWATRVRAVTSPWRTPSTGWRQLARWVAAVAYLLAFLGGSMLAMALFGLVAGRAIARYPQR